MTTIDHDTREAIREAGLAAAEKLRALSDAQAQAIASFEADEPITRATTIAQQVPIARDAALDALRNLTRALHDAAFSPPSPHPNALTHAANLGLGGATDTARWAKELERWSKSLRGRGRPRKDPERLAHDEHVRSFCVTAAQREWLRAQPNASETMRRLIDRLANGDYPAEAHYQHDGPADLTTGARLGDYETTLHHAAQEAGQEPWAMLRAAIEREMMRGAKDGRKKRART